MINEIWLIHDGICIYHKVLKDPLDPDFKGLNLEEQLFSGFISALLNFGTSQLQEHNHLQKITFQENIFEIMNVEKLLVVLSLNLTYLSEQKLKQSVVSLVDEIEYQIQTQDTLIHLRNNRKINSPKLLSLVQYKNIFDQFMEKILNDIYTIQDQLIMVDILTLIQIIEETRSLLDKLEIESQSIGVILSLSVKAKRILQKIELIKEESTIELYKLQKEFKGALQDSFQSINQEEIIKNKEINGVYYKNILKFLKKNYKILKQFGFEDLFFEELVITI